MVISMANMIDYLLWRGDLDFQSSPFNEVDSLILTQLVYLDFDGIVPDLSSKSYITLGKAGQAYLKKFQDRPTSSFPPLIQDCMEVLKSALKTRRFKNCRLSKYVGDINKDEEYQFSAMKILLGDGSVYLAFSGTDNSLTGWKENFNMSYLTETPSQRKAVEYVNEVLTFGRRNVRLGGHSKGGNLAVYSAVKSKKSIQNRLIDIYNFDGPGFTREMVSREEYQNVLSKIHTIIPQSSVIGMLLEHEESYSVIESAEKGLLQHRAISWQISGPHMVHLDKLTEHSIFWDGTLKQWLKGLNTEERKSFVNALFHVFDNAGIQDTNQLNKMTLNKFISLLKAVDKLSEEERECLSSPIKKLVDQAGKRNRKIKRSQIKTIL